jgi:hypothetical protein
VNWSNWATVADLCTAPGTLILAVATFSAVRSANLTAPVAQQSLLENPAPACTLGVILVTWRAAARAEIRLLMSIE